MNFFKNYRILLFLLSSLLIINAGAGKIMIIMGASCSGKSTLSKRLLSMLGEQWRLVELDVIEDDFKSTVCTQYVEKTFYNFENFDQADIQFNSSAMTVAEMAKALVEKI